MSGPIHLDPASVEAIAQRVAELLRGEALAGELVDPTMVARRFGVSRDYVYEHATELGAVRLGDGPKARLRFDPAIVAERLAPDPPRAARPENRRRKGARERDGRTPSGAELLPIRGPTPPSAHDLHERTQ